MSANRDRAWRPGAVWSVWDMLEVDGKRFIAAIYGVENA